MVIDLIIYIIIPPRKSLTMSFENLYPPQKKKILATPLSATRNIGNFSACLHRGGPGGFVASDLIQYR